MSVVDRVEIQQSAFSGRNGTYGGTLYLFAKELRVNSCEDSSFWLNIDLSNKKGGYKPYSVNSITTFNIPPEACHGRIGNQKNTFAAELNMNSMELRVNCYEDPSFWIAVDLSSVQEFI